MDGKRWDTAHPPTLDRYRAHDIEAMVARLDAGKERRAQLSEALTSALALGGGIVIAAAAGQADRLYSTRRACPRCGSGLPFPDPRLFSWSQRFGACPVCHGLGAEALPGNGEHRPCPACGGRRLCRDALAVRIAGRNIAEIAALTVSETLAWLRGLTGVLPEVHETIMPELRARLALLEEIGLGYLALERSSDTLSTGEAQRIRIAAQLASNLRGVCYVLDEPTVGLHARDSEVLIRALIALRDRRATVIVVEHDEATIRAADHVIDLGPGAGPHGGKVVAAGPPHAIACSRRSVTGRWLRGEGERLTWRRRALGDAPRLRIVGARLYNLAGLTVEFPLGRLVCVTGVSGSGKSTLVRDVLFCAVKAKLRELRLPPVLENLEGWEELRHAQEVDESPIGPTHRSVPATYVGVMDAIRTLYAATPEARARGYRPGRFSFNVSGGRCERCQGEGRLEVRMSLLPVVYTTCEACGGRRYNLDTLDVTFKEKSVADVLASTVDEARALFHAFPAISRPLEFLSDVGLGYLRLGQPSRSLSGGEAQRVKLAAELASPHRGHTLYVLDEPTTGLHMADVARVVAALQRLVDRGDTIVVIEHNLDVIAAADCVIDLGPESGDRGGSVVAWGPPEQIVRSAHSRTAPYLAKALRRA